MNYSNWKKYVHSDWSDFSAVSAKKSEKHYFAAVDAAQTQEALEEMEQGLKIHFPEELLAFYETIGAGNLWINKPDKIGLYNILAPIEIHDVYYPFEEEDLFITYRQSAWENLEEGKLLAFCIFGEEDSLLYYGLDDDGIYYLSREEKIADSLADFFKRIDKQADYFIES